MRESEGIATKSFCGAKGGREHYISISAPSDLSLDEQIELVQARYIEAQRSLGLSAETAVFRRVFLSDVINQAEKLRTSPLGDESEGNPVAVSIVQQPPLSGSKIALLAYHVEGAIMKKRRLSPKHMMVERNGLRHLWSTRLCAGAYGSAVTVDAQTQEIFDDLINTLSANGGNLREHCVRTWLYLKNVDVFYQGMVERRGKLFAQHGLTKDTHYIASTGIEGACPHRFDLVLMDAYSNLDLTPAQISYLTDLDRLCATKDYDVHFERGTRVAYADRMHHFISGTASIDNAGEVVHPGDVLKQLERALVNVDALLHSGGASIDNMSHMIVYLRDRSDFSRVDDYLAERFPDLPIIAVQGAVCRPAWLVEVEGIAINSNDDPTLPSF